MPTDNTETVLSPKFTDAFHYAATLAGLFGVEGEIGALLTVQDDALSGHGRTLHLGWVRDSGRLHAG
jgi:hypothetical protein